MKIAFITNSQEQCGVGQFGRQIDQAMQAYSKNEIATYFIGSKEDLISNEHQIANADIIFANYHSGPLPFLPSSFIFKLNKPIIGIVHDYEYNQFKMYSELHTVFTYRMHPNPALVSAVPNMFMAPRIIPDIAVSCPNNDIFTVGSFGFEIASTKAYEKIITYIETHFDNAHIKLHIPFAHFGDKDGQRAKDVARNCKKYVTKKNIKLTISHDFMSLDVLIQQFLAQNDLNFCYYNQVATGGISSTVDMALAAERPLALSDSYMFQHLRYFAPELFIDKNTLQSILAVGGDKVKFLKDLWSPRNAANFYDNMFDKVMNDWKKSHHEKYNTILNNTARASLQGQTEKIAISCPTEFARKIPEANVQQAFVKNTVEHFIPKTGRILSVGCFEDTAFLALEKEGYKIEGIDPVINRSLGEHYKYWDNTKPYDAIFSTSVIEHTPDDEEFIEQIAMMLAPGGYAILTMDFKKDFKAGDSIIGGNTKFYSTAYILEYLVPRMKFCELIDCHHWDDSESDFSFGGFTYSFATLVFRKKSLLNEQDLFYENEVTSILKNRLIINANAVTKKTKKQALRHFIAPHIPRKMKNLIKKLWHI